MRIAVVIPFREEWTFLGGLLRSICQQTRPPDEIVFVMDGGRPEDAARLAKEARAGCSDRLQTRLRVLQQPWAGPAAARNRGASESTAEAIVFLEADGEYSANYLERAQGSLAHAAVGAVSPELRVPQLTGLGWTARYQRARWTGIALLTRAHRRPVLGGWGFRREVFERVGGYDEGLRVGEDRDLVERVRSLGLKIVVARRTFYRHPEPSTLTAMCVKAFRRARQATLFYQLHRPAVYVAARALSVAVLALGTLLGVVTAVRQSAWPLFIGGTGLVAVLLATVGRAWCDPVVVAGARAERRNSSSRSARIVFASARALEQMATIAGAAWGSLVGRSSDTRLSRARGITLRL